MVIVTASSNHYFNYLENFLNTLDVYNKNLQVIIYDLGLTPEQLNLLREKKYIVRNFDFSLYPKFIRLDNNIPDPDNNKNRIKKGCSVFKSIIVNDLLYESRDIVLWMDCRINITGSLQNIKDLILKNGFYFPTFKNKTIISSTHPFTLQYLNIGADIYNELLLVNQIMGWNYHKNGILSLSNSFKSFCLVENWIKPEGANDTNHSFEYSILSILFYQYKQIYNFNFEELPPDKLNFSLMKR